MILLNRPPIPYDRVLKSMTDNDQQKSQFYFHKNHENPDKSFHPKIILYRA